MRTGIGRSAAAMLSVALVAVASPALAGHEAPRGYEAVGYGPEGLAGLGYGHGPWFAFPYHTKSALYGYPDFAYGRGPLINLGGAALQPGFRGYGVFGSPGYGLGMYPSTWIDQRPGWGHGHGLGGGHRHGW